MVKMALEMSFMVIGEMKICQANWRKQVKFCVCYYYKKYCRHSWSAATIRDDFKNYFISSEGELR